MKSQSLLALLIVTSTVCAANTVPAMTPVEPAPITSELSIGEASAQLTAKRFSVHALAQHYLMRIDALDAHGPHINSIIELNPDALSIADRLDAAKIARGPLFGIPVLIKDNIDTADAMHTTAGSLALLDSRPTRDAFIVRRLRQAGAVILGKTNLSEWANFRSTRSSSGWSGRGGQTHNPYALDRNPCGSSSGSGAAIAADFAIVAVGSETDGSIICPSSVNGLVGIKPTVGLVSRSGIIPISASQDTAGPMARSVTDAATLLTVLAGYDPDDPATTPLKNKPPVDYTQALKADALKGARIGVVRKLAGFHDGVDTLFDQAIAQLNAAGAVIVDPVEIPTQGQFDTDEQTVLLYEFKDGINRYLADRAGGPKTLADLIAFNTREAAQEMPYFGQELFIQAQSKGDLKTPEYIEAHQRAKRLAGLEGIDAALAKDHLDALLAPSLGPSWPTDWINGDHVLGGGSTSAAAVAGYPHITVPMGLVHGLPVGLSFMAGAWREEALIGLAYGYEQVSHARRAPSLSR